MAAEEFDDLTREELFGQSVLNPLPHPSFASLPDAFLAGLARFIVLHCFSLKPHW